MNITCISDTHGLHNHLSLDEGDILLHAGDISNYGTISQIENFNKWLGEQKAKFNHIICIAGNHDYGLDLNHFKGQMYNPDKISGKELLSNAIYLDNEEIVIDGIKFYGSPQQPFFHNWAFNVERGEEIKKYWDKIPKDTNVLITHGPIHKVLDKTYYDKLNVGCEELAKTVKDLKQLKLHVCGHIHETFGYCNIDGVYFVNASICDLNYDPCREPIIINI